MLIDGAYVKEENDALYQLTDPFTLFAIGYIKNPKINSWNTFINTPAYNAWRGYSFEIVCFNHIQKIKELLGISGIDTNEFAWRSSKSENGAQIDLIIDRKDGVVNLCEMKYTNNEYSLDQDEHDKILNRMTLFQKESGIKKAVHITLVCGNGFKRNKYSGIVQNVINGEDFFE